MRLRSLILGILLVFGALDLSAQTPAYQDAVLSFEARARDLVGRMTLEEKVSQMKDVAPAIERLGIPEYNWWNEALHGVARSGTATVQLPLPASALAYWNVEGHRWVVEEEPVRIQVGASSADIRLESTITIVGGG